MSFAIAAAALSGVSALAQIKAGKQAQLAYKQQAERAKLEGRQKALEYRAKGVDSLRQISKNIASVNARAAAGGIDPFSGTPQTVKAVSTEAGFTDALVLRENAQLVELGGVMQAGEYEMAGRQARLQSYIGAATTLASGAFQYKQLK